jgi:hypothetical protein
MSRPIYTDAAGAAAVSGMLVFPTCLFTAQRLILRPLRIAAHHKLLGTVFGGLVVASASIVASESARATYRAVNVIQGRKKIASIFETAANWEERWALYATGGVFAFVGLGGRLRSVAPSHLWHLGAFYGRSIPAQGANYASEAERALLQKIGKRSGCHTCGTKSGPFNGDHQPPNSIAKRRFWTPKQRFYPQCQPCSSQQGASLAKKTPVYHNHSALRLHHVWLPFGLAVSWDLGLE